MILEPQADLGVTVKYKFLQQKKHGEVEVATTTMDNINNTQKHDILTLRRGDKAALMSCR